ncbi:MAG: thio(seleno)oxazole modification radical SAM maturase SbtM [Desulfobulbaceae bacterium]
MTFAGPSLAAIYPTCCRILPALATKQVTDLDLAPFLEANPDALGAYPYLPDLARIEAARHRVSALPSPPVEPVAELTVNRVLELLRVQWRNLPLLLHDSSLVPEQGEEYVLVWKAPGREEMQTATASGHDLLALKMAEERIDSRIAAAEAGARVNVIDAILWSACQRGLLLAPGSLLVRAPEFPRGVVDNPEFYTARTFTLQWHITQTCDLHCRHCYDRSQRQEFDLAQGIKVLDELYDFSRERHVFTQVSFTGGNPMLHPHFLELYREAADRGFLTAVLGNPMPRHRIEEMIAVQHPEFYQVSLEGLKEHNDYIRGQGHFDRVLAFLDLLRELKIYSMVMLTLTRANLAQVIPLAEVLRDRADLFTFNRLAMVGEGASLASAPPEDFPQFLETYLAAREHNPCMGLKESMINILRLRDGQPLFGGCAGFGCGAAFNFLALLPDGEVHACRKFPSQIGNLSASTLHDIYEGEAARRYRRGSAACQECPIRPVCGGCLAVTHGFGRNIFVDRDPYCFIERLQNPSP